MEKQGNSEEHIENVEGSSDKVQNSPKMEENPEMMV